MSMHSLVVLSAMVFVQGFVDDYCSEGVSLLQFAKTLTDTSFGNAEYPHYQKNVNSMRSGSSTLTSTLNLTTPSWVYEIAGGFVMYSAPLLDGHGNIYMVATSGDVFSVNEATGVENWRVNVSYVPGILATTPILLAGNLYIANELGFLFCLSMASGEKKWQSLLVEKPSISGFDAWSMAGSGNVVLAAGRPLSDRKDSGSGSRLYAASTDDGHVLWNFSFPRQVYNIMPAIVGDTVVIADWSGGVISLRLSDGAPLWEVVPPSLNSNCTGGLAVGPNGLVYVTSNSGSTFGSDGILSAYQLSSGQLVWRQVFTGFPANAAPAVFPRSDGKLAVVLGIGANFMLPYLSEVEVMLPRRTSDSVVALSAETGENLWSFKTDAWPLNSVAGSVFFKKCWPDSWSNPTVDAAGTVYIGWGAAKVFALSGQTGSVLGSFDFGSGIQGPPSVDSGTLVVASCNKLVAFRNP